MSGGVLKNAPHYAVVGAGLAGVACAIVLQQVGIRVSVFEKNRAASGRMSTRRTETSNCDHGAQYFTAKDPTFQAEVQRWVEAGTAGIWQPKIKVFGNKKIQSQENVCTTNIQRYIGIPKMTTPVRWLCEINKIHVETNCTVDKIQRDSDLLWRLHCVEKGWLEPRFDGLLFAVPAPQVVPLISDVAPILTELANNVRMRACWALMLQYRNPIDIGFDAAFVNEGPLRWVARNNSKPGRSEMEHWLLHAEAEWSERNQETNPNDVAKIMLEEFEKIGGNPPQHWMIHRWRYADSPMPSKQGYAWNPDQNIGLCGDWLHGGRVEGAWLSGNALACGVVGTPKL